MNCPGRSTLPCLVLAAACLFPAALPAQVDPLPPGPDDVRVVDSETPIQTGLPPLAGPQQVPPGELTYEPRYGLTTVPDPNQALITETSPVPPPQASLFRNVRLGTLRVPDLDVDEQLAAVHKPNGPEFKFSGPLFVSRGLPEDAQFKLGDWFFFAFRSVSASMLHSDNIDLTQNNPKSGTIAIMRLTADALLQFNDYLRLAASGTLIYLPIQGKVGLAGFGLDPLAPFENALLAHAQLTYDLNLNQWQVEFIDDFRVRDGVFGPNFAVFGTYDEEDREGRYVFRDNTPAAPGGVEDRNSHLDDNFFVSRNLVGVSASRLLPTETRMTVGVDREDYWYTGVNGSSSSLPSSRELGYISLDSERENLRFQPFASYRVYRYDDSPNWTQEALAGFRGPITENLALTADIGWFHVGGSDRSGYLGGATLVHNLGPNTRQSLEYRQELTEPVQDLERSWIYLLSQRFGYDVLGELYGIRATFEDESNTGTGGGEWLAGARVTHGVGQEIIERLGTEYEQITYDNQSFGDTYRWRVIGEIQYKTLWLQGIYQNTRRVSALPLDSYRENLVLLTVTKYF